MTHQSGVTSPKGGQAAELGCHAQDSNHQTVPESKWELPEPGFQLHPLLSRDCASPSSAGGHVLQLLLREGASEHTGTVSNAGGGHMQTWPRKAKQDASAPKGSGQPIPLAFSSTEYDGLLDKPVDPSLPCDTAKWLLSVERSNLTYSLLQSTHWPVYCPGEKQSLAIGRRAPKDTRGAGSWTVPAPRSEIKLLLQQGFQYMVWLLLTLSENLCQQCAQ